MERLTEYHAGVAVIRDKARQKEAMEKLAAYESTGLTSEEIMDGKMLTGWIPVEERLPEPGQEVLAYIKHNYAEDGWRAYRVYEYTDHFVGMGNMCEVLAWMTLPEPYHPDRCRGRFGAADAECGRCEGE